MPDNSIHSKQVELEKLERIYESLYWTHLELKKKYKAALARLKRYEHRERSRTS